MPISYQACHTLSKILYTNVELKEILDSAIEHMIQYFNVPCVELYQIDSEAALKLVAQIGLSPQHADLPGDTLIESVFQSGRTILIESLLEDPRPDQKKVRKEGLACFAGAPLASQKERIGVLALYDRSPRTFSQTEQETLTEFGRIIGTAIHHFENYEIAAKRAKRYIAISRAISVTRQLGAFDQVLSDIVKIVVQSLGFDQCWFGLVHEKRNALAGKAGFGLGMRAAWKNKSYPLDSKSMNPAVRAVLDKKINTLHSIDHIEKDDFRRELEKHGIQNICCVPVLRGNTAIGVLGVFNQSYQEIAEEDVKALSSVADQAGAAIENARLYDKIKTSEEEYRSLFESTGTSLLILDENFQIKLVNKAFEALSGLGRNDLVGKRSFVSFFKNEKINLDSFKQDIQKTQSNWEYAFTADNGDVKQVHLIITPLPASTDFLVSLINMTRERELERKLYRSEELAAIGELSAGIAHEIRNPLVSILTSVGLLKEEEAISDEGRQLLDVVKEESDHLAAIVDDFLQFAKPKKPNIEPEDIHQLLRDAIKRVNEWNEKEVKWAESYDSRLINVCLDRYQIQQVITNLIMNAIDAVDQNGLIKIKTSFVKYEGIPHARIQISDTGIGIAEENLSKIFQPFYSTKEKGTGMGLAICRRIIEEHGGEIQVKSQMEKGTTFSVFIPVEPVKRNHARKGD